MARRRELDPEHEGGRGPKRPFRVAGEGHVDGPHEVGDELREQAAALVGRRARGVAEHAVGAHGGHAVGLHPGQQLARAARSRPPRRRRGGPRSRCQGEQQRRLGATRVGIGTRQRPRPGEHSPALGPARRDRPLQRRHVPAVPVHEHHPAEGVGRADDLHHHLLERLVPDRQGAGERRRARRSRRRAPRGPRRGRALRPPAPSASATARRVSVSSGRWGPCCSSEPRGTSRSGGGSRAATSGQVRPPSALGR